MVVSVPSRLSRAFARCSLAALFLWTVVAVSPGIAAVSASAAAMNAGETLSYADLADRFAQVPVALTARVVDAIPVAESAVAPSRPGTIRYYVVADVVALIRGPASGLPPRLSWLVDVPVDGRGRPPRLKRQQVIVAAVTVAGRPGELQLASRDAQLIWAPAIEARVRAIVAAALAPDAPPVITGIASAFHVAGTLPGEGETQIFLSTASRQPVSLSVLRRPGQTPSWSVALGEIVDEAAAPPPRDTLGWYRLACFLPAELPAAATRELAATDAESARTDYRFVVTALGNCGRSRS